MVDNKFIPSTCSFCGVGCGVVYHVMDGRILQTLPMKSHPVSEGGLCIKGWNLHEHVHQESRLKDPMVKKNGQLETASWDEALSFAADRLKGIIEEHGPDSVGVLCSAKITNEENYVAQKFTRAAVGTNNVDHCARL